MTSKPRPIAIVGAGPVGSILGAHYANAGRDVVMVDASAARCTQIERVGLQVVGTQTVSARPAAVERGLEALKELAPEAIYICTKTWALKGLLPALAEVAPADALIVCYQNGIGPEEFASSYFPCGNIARGIANYAGAVEEDGRVNMQWFTPPNFIGPLDDERLDEMQRIAAQLSSSGLETQAISFYEIKKKAFFKTILNSALNALCANAGITMRQAMTYRHTRALARLLLREGLSVATAVGYHYGEDSLNTCLGYLDKGGDHLPSMWTDLQRKSPTEIEYINGAIARIGLMFKNVDVDVNLFFTSLIVTQEIKSGVRAPDEVPEYLEHMA